LSNGGDGKIIKLQSLMQARGDGEEHVGDPDMFPSPILHTSSYRGSYPPAIGMNTAYKHTPSALVKKLLHKKSRP
jgi:hypothetical protein